MEIEGTGSVSVSTSTATNDESKSPKKRRNFPQLPPTAAESCAVPDGLIRSLVLSYLLRNCYRATALAFVTADADNPPAQQNGHTPLPDSPSDASMSDARTPDKAAHLTHSLTPAELDQLDQRRSMMDRILSGDICGGIALAESLLSSPATAVSKTTLKDAFPAVFLRLLCQHFVELMRQRKPIDAISFARDTIAPLSKSIPSGLLLLQNYLPLLAYMDPETSPVFDLLDVAHRQTLAEELNDYVFAYLHQSQDGKQDPSVFRQSGLERLMRQLSVLMNKLPGDAKDKEERPKWTLAEALMEAKADSE